MSRKDAEADQSGICRKQLAQRLAHQYTGELQFKIRNHCTSGAQGISGGRPSGFCQRHKKVVAGASLDLSSGPVNPRRCHQYNNNYYNTLFLPKARCVCRQAACKGCQILTPCWTRQIQARPNQPWAWCSVFIPLPASRGHISPIMKDA